MTQYRASVIEKIQPTLDLLNNFRVNLQVLLGHIHNINVSIQSTSLVVINFVSNRSLSLSAALDLQSILVTQLTALHSALMTDLNMVYEALKGVIDALHAQANQLQFGRCAWLGAFWAGGDPDNTGTPSLHDQFCDSFGLDLTISTWALFVLTCAMVVTWALMLVYIPRLKRPNTPPVLGAHVHVNPFMHPSASAGQIAVSVVTTQGTRGQTPRLNTPRNVSAPSMY